jgi:hypothetical protein
MRTSQALPERIAVKHFRRIDDGVVGGDDLAGHGQKQVGGGFDRVSTTPLAAPASKVSPTLGQLHIDDIR